MFSVSLILPNSPGLLMRAVFARDRPKIEVSLDLTPNAVAALTCLMFLSSSPLTLQVY